MTEHMCKICGEVHPRGLGGTAIGRIFGLIPGTNALDIYHYLTRPEPEEPADKPVSIHQYRGHVFEPMALDHFWAKTGWRGRNMPSVSTHPDYPAFQCHLDFEIFADPDRIWEGEPAPEWMQGTGVGETKSPSSGVIQSYLNTGLRQSELLQAYTYAAVRRVRWACFNYFTMEHEAGPTIVVPIELPADLGDFILKAGQRFMDEHVTPRIPPDPTEWMLMARDEMPPLPELSGERIEVADPDVVEAARLAVEARDVAADADELSKRRQAELETLLVATGHKRLTVPGVGRFSVVQKEGTVSFNKGALEIARPLDWDKVRAYLLAEIRAEEGIDDRLLEMQLDLTPFERQGDPSQYILLPRRKKDD